MTIAQLTKRVAELEAQVKRLQEHTRPVDPSSSAHWLATAGIFKDDPLFEEAVRLGRQYRESLRPGTRKKKGQKKPARRLAS